MTALMLILIALCSNAAKTLCNIILPVVRAYLVDSEVYCVLVVLSEVACRLSAGTTIYIWPTRDWPVQQSTG